MEQKIGGVQIFPQHQLFLLLNILYLGITVEHPLEINIMMMLILF